MPTFERYLHLERLGTTEVEGLLDGRCYIFPKLDGTNSSVWQDDAGALRAGSRNRTLSFDFDNAGFLVYAVANKAFYKFLSDHPKKRLYGEWLVPHSLKTYRADAWNKFYVFDVTDDNGEYMHYDEYSSLLKDYDIEYIPALKVAEYPSLEKLYPVLEQNTFLVEEGKGFGEGIVIKNYDFKNKFGRLAFAKLVSNDFKAVFHREMGPDELRATALVEEKIAQTYITSHFVNKIIAKIENEKGAFSSTDIPRLLHTAYYDLVKEELWDAIKNFKIKSLSFDELQRQVNRYVKAQKPELFGIKERISNAQGNATSK